MSPEIADALPAASQPLARPPAEKVRRRKNRPGAGRPRGSYASVKCRGVVRADEVLTIAAFCERMEVSRQYVDELRDRGLRVVEENGRFVKILGADYLVWLAQQPTAIRKPRPPKRRPADESQSPATGQPAAEATHEVTEAR
jgi:hypothetical protein